MKFGSNGEFFSFIHGFYFVIFLVQIPTLVSRSLVIHGQQDYYNEEWPLIMV